MNVFFYFIFIIIFLLCTHQKTSNAIEQKLVDYFVYNEIDDEYTKIGLSLVQQKGLLVYAQRNGATSSNDNLVSNNNAAWHDFDQKKTFGVTNDADVIASIKYPYTLLGTNKGIFIIKYQSSSGDYVEELKLMPSEFNEAFEMDTYAMSKTSFAVAGKNNNTSARCLLYYTRVLPTNWERKFTKCVDGDIFATSLAANDNILAVGYKESKIELVDISANNIVWTSNSVIDSPPNLDTGASGLGGFATVLYIEGNFLAVGGPSLKNDDHTGSHHGRVYIYNITKRDAFHGPYEIPVPSDLIAISTDSEEGSSIGVQFGASFFISEFLTTTSVPSIFVGIGAPGANGVVIYYLECSYSNNGNVANMFQVKGSVLIQGFRLKLDHDTGDSVSWDIQGERMLLGAPKADNYDEYGGVETQYGAVGRLYVATICQPNRYRYSPNPYSYIKTCQNCDSGKYSNGGYVNSCTTCGDDNSKPVNANWLGTGKGCAYKCNDDYFGTLCETCEDYMLPEVNPPSNSQWKSINGVCKFKCNSDYDVTGDGIGCTPAAAPANVAVTNIKWSSVVVTWAQTSSGWAKVQMDGCPSYSIDIWDKTSDTVVGVALVQATCTELETSVTIVSLNARVFYSFRLRRGTTGLMSPYTAAIETLEAVPASAPHNITVISKEGGMLKLHWSTPIDNGGIAIEKYSTVVCKDENIGNVHQGCQRINSTQTMVTISALRAYGTYQFRIAAFTHVHGNFSSSQSVTMGKPYLPSILESPVLVATKCSTVNISVPVLSYNEDGGEAPLSYVFRIVNQHNGIEMNQTRKREEAGTNNIFRLLFFENSKIYKIFVRARNSVGDGPESVQSLEILVQAEICLPDPPRSIKISNVRSDSAIVCLKRPAEDGGIKISNYSVYVYNSASTGVFLENVIPVQENGRSKYKLYETEICSNITKLLGSTTYYLHATTVTTLGRSTISASSNAFSTLAPMPPTWFVDQTFSQNGLFGGKISINWAEPGSHGGSPILYYRVKYYKLRSGVTVCDSAAVDQSFSDTVYTNIIIQRLVSSSNYCIFVHAFNALGNSVLSGAGSTGQIDSASAPVNITVLAVTPSSATFTWLPSKYLGGSEFLNYRVSVMYSNNTNHYFFNEVPCTVFKLQGSRNYTFTIATITRGVASVGVVGELSSAITFQTASPTVPGAPYDLYANPDYVGASFVKLSWKVPVETGGRDIINDEIVVYTLLVDNDETNRDFEEVNRRYLYHFAGDSVTVGSLIANTTYKFIIRLTNAIGSSNYSLASPAIQLLEQVHPAKPSVLSLNHTTGSTLKLLCKQGLDIGGASSGSVYYIGNIRSSLSHIKNFFGKMENSEETLITVGNLQAETAYNISIRMAVLGWPSEKSKAVNLNKPLLISVEDLEILTSTANSSVKGEVTSPMLNMSMGAIPDFVALKVSFNSISFRWKSPSNDNVPSRYKITCIDGDGSQYQITTSLLFTTIPGLSAQTYYGCHIVAFDDNGIETLKTEIPYPIYTRIEFAPGKPIDVRIVGDEYSSILLVRFQPPVWVNFNPNLHYRVELFRTRYESIQEVYTKTLVRTIDFAASESFGEEDAVDVQMPGGLARTMYAVRVAAINQVGKWGLFSEYSNFYSIGNVTYPGIASNLRLDGLATSSSFKVSWEAPVRTGGVIKEELFYLVCCDQVSFILLNISACGIRDGSVLIRTEKKQTTATVSNLLGNTMYTCQVTAVNWFGKGNSSSYNDFTSVGTLAATVPGTMQTIPTARYVTADSIVFGWELDDFDSGGSPILKYITQCSKNSSLVTATKEVDIYNNEVTFQGLSAQTTYCCKVKAVNNIGEGEYGASCLMIETGSPTAPTGVINLRSNSVAIPSGGYMNITLWWDIPFETGGLQLTYDVYLSKRMGFFPCQENKNFLGLTCVPSYSPSLCEQLPWPDENQDYIKIAETKDTQVSNVLLFGGRLYYLKVRVRNNEGSKNETIKTVTEAMRPSIPTGLQAISSLIKANSMNISWIPVVNTGGCDNSLKYDFEGTDVSYGRKIVTANGLIANSIVPSSLNCSSSYRWCVRSKTEIGTSSWNCGLVAKTLSAPPSKVCGLSVASVNPVSIEIKWKPPCDTCGGTTLAYDVKIQFQANGEIVPSTMAANGNTDPSIDLSQKSFRFSDLDYATGYIVSVRAKSEFGIGSWTSLENVETEPRVQCKKSIPLDGMCLTTESASLSSTLPCSCHGKCHPWDGSCACFGGWKGNDCNTPDGIKMTLVLSGNIESWRTEDYATISTLLASAIGIDSKRIPPGLMSVNSGSVILNLEILNPILMVNEVIGKDISAESAGSIVENLVLEGDLTSLPVESVQIGGHGGEKVIAPPTPSCEYVDDDSCVSCVSQPGCGWCDSQKFCALGSKYGVGLLQGASCNSKSKWRFGEETKDMCDPTTIQVCNQHRTCGSCLIEQSVACGWCAETGTCIPHKKHQAMCQNWGYTIGSCSADCSRNDFRVEYQGYVWLGDDKPGSELFYKGNKQCKWHIAPGQDPAAENSYEVGRIDIVLERADIGRRDRLIIYEGNSRSSDAILIDINGNSGSDGGETEFPIEVTTSSNMVIVEFSSDQSAQTVGTGFLAHYKSHKKTFWDSYILVTLTFLTICSCMCCLCFRCMTFTNHHREVENDFGMNLEATDRGASLNSINKFPTFTYTEQHKLKLEKLEQEISCSICLCDYEDGEEVRLLPCGHTFHSPCIDAWLQINSICPLCKVNVIDLATEKRKTKRKERRKQLVNKVMRRGRGSSKNATISPRKSDEVLDYSARSNQLLEIGGSSKKKTKKKKKKKKRPSRSDVSPSIEELNRRNNTDHNDAFWGLNQHDFEEENDNYMVVNRMHGRAIQFPNHNRTTRMRRSLEPPPLRHRAGMFNQMQYNNSDEEEQLALAIELSTISRREGNNRRTRQRVREELLPIGNTPHRRPSRINAPVLTRNSNDNDNTSNGNNNNNRRNSVLV
jgi:hypothetical protein